MRVYSWNMYCFNKKPKAVIDYLSTLKADVVCLQEVPMTLLTEITALFPYSAYAVDSEQVRGHKELTNFNVILSRYPLTDITPIPLDHIHHPIRAKIAIRVMRSAGWAPTKNRHALAAVVESPVGKLQVFCAHLTLSSPSGRAKEFAKLLPHRNSKVPAVVAGDFNVLEHPRVKPLSWFLGASLKESLPTYPERKLFEERFKNAQFKNPLKGRVTHNFSKSQLDHVLVSDQLSVGSIGVDPYLNGSDHYPVYVDIRA